MRSLLLFKYLLYVSCHKKRLLILPLLMPVLYISLYFQNILAILKQIRFTQRYLYYFILSGQPGVAPDINPNTFIL